MLETMERSAPERGTTAMPAMHAVSSPRSCLKQAPAGSTPSAVREPDPGAHERRVLDAAGAGEEWAWREIFDEHYPSLYRFLRSRVPTNEVAEDLTSDVLLEAYRSIKKFSWRGRPFGAWLFGIARHVLASYYRSRRQTVSMDAAEVDLGHTQPEYLDLEIRETLERLRPDHRMALELRYVVGLSGQEAAAVMGHTHGSFRTLLFRARRAFQQESQGDVDGSEADEASSSATSAPAILRTLVESQPMAAGA